MPYTAPKVCYSATVNGTYTELTGVQSVNISRGRQRSTDAFSGSSCVVEIIPANSYALPLAIGQFLDVRTTNSGASPCFYSGRITDVQRRYSIPYNSATGAAPADRIFLTVSGGTGVIGAQVTDSTTFLTGGSDVILEAQNRAEGGAGVYASNIVTYPSVLCSAQTIAIGTSLMTTISQLLNTAQWVIDDGDQGRVRVSSYDYACVFYPSSATGANIAFTDDGTAGFKYSNIEYVSSLQSSFSAVVVQPEGLTSQVALTGNLRNSFVLKSFDQTTAQAQNLANYFLTVSQQTTPTPFVIQTSTAVSDTAADLGRYMTYPIGTAVTVKFRGTTVFATVQGWSFGYYPDMANVQVYLSASLGTPFTLDSSAFGVLDTNRLGYP